MENMVAPGILPGALQGVDVLRVGHHADGGPVPPGAAADGAQAVALGKVLAFRAQGDGALGGDDGVGKGVGLLLGKAQHKEGQPLGGLLAHPRQTGELLGQRLQGRGEVFHR